jgi:hypothetical protein
MSSVDVSVFCARACVRVLRVCFNFRWLHAHDVWGIHDLVLYSHPWLPSVETSQELCSNIRCVNRLRSMLFDASLQNLFLLGDLRKQDRQCDGMGGSKTSMIQVPPPTTLPPNAQASLWSECPLRLDEYLQWARQSLPSHWNWSVPLPIPREQQRAPTNDHYTLRYVGYA